MIPTEVYTLLASSLLTGFFKHKAQVAKDLHEERLARAEAVDKKAERNEGTFQKVFRGAIVMSLITVMLFPTIAPAFIPNLKVSIAYFEDNRAILGIFGTLSDKLKYVDLREGSMVILPGYRHMLASILGYFFGASAMARR